MQSAMVASQQTLIRRVSSTPAAAGSTSPSTSASSKISDGLASSKRNNNDYIKDDGTGSVDMNHDNIKPPKVRRSTSSNNWFSLLNPSYKTRFHEFRKLFSGSIPSNERLVVDYSCALQREILVHGRVYVSLNYICFYAKIIKWETLVVLKFRDIATLVKANTARVIPNAIQIQTVTGEKYFLTSFAARDKTYVMMFRVWQNALLDQPVSSAEIWKWVHMSYGEDLGYTSEEEEEMKDEFRDEVPLSFGRQESGGSDSMSSIESKQDAVSEISTGRVSSHIMDDAGCEAEDEDQDSLPLVPMICSCIEHRGKLLVDDVFPISVQTAFSLIFTDSTFYRKVLDDRKTSQVSVGSWEDAPQSLRETEPEVLKVRTLKYTVSLNHAMLKSAPTIETQYLLKSPSPEVYMVKSEAVNHDIPYANKYSVRAQYCVTRGKFENEVRLVVHAEVIYHTNSWSFRLMKPMIEKNALQGISDYIKDLVSGLHKYCHETPSLSLDSSSSSSQLKGDNNTLIRRPSRKTDSLNSRKSLRLFRNIAADDDEISLATIDTDHAAGPVNGITSIRCGKSSRTASLPRNVVSSKRGAGGSGYTSDSFLLKIIVGILFILFMSHIFLYLRLWKLEAAVGDSDAGVVDSTAIGSGAGTTDPFTLLKWKKVLTRALGLIQVMEKGLTDFNQHLNDDL